jgi:hypothetical protein
MKFPVLPSPFILNAVRTLEGPNPFNSLVYKFPSVFIAIWKNVQTSAMSLAVLPVAFITTTVCQMKYPFPIRRAILKATMINRSISVPILPIAVYAITLYTAGLI